MIVDGVRPAGAARRAASPLIRSRALAIAIALASVFSLGWVRTRDATVCNAVCDLGDRVASNLGASACAREVLSRHGLLRAALVDPAGAALRLEAVHASCPEGEPGAMLALAELWYRAALREPHHDPASAVAALRASAAAAALALARPRTPGAAIAPSFSITTLWPGSSGSRRTNASPGAGTGRWCWPSLGSW